MKDTLNCVALGVMLGVLLWMLLVDNVTAYLCIVLAAAWVMRRDLLPQRA